MLAMTPSGSWAMTSDVDPSCNTVSSPSTCGAASRKKSMRGSSPRSSLWLWVIGLPVSRVSVEARSSV